MAKTKVKPKPKKKAAPKKKVTIEVVLKEMKKIYKRLDGLERDILILRGIEKPRTPQPEEGSKDTEIETRFGFLTSL